MNKKFELKFEDERAGGVCVGGEKKNDLSENVLFRSTLWNYKLVWHFFSFFNFAFFFFPLQLSASLIFTTINISLNKFLMFLRVIIASLTKVLSFLFSLPPPRYIFNPHHTLNLLSFSLFFFLFFQFASFHCCHLTEENYYCKVSENNEAMMTVSLFLYVFFFITVGNWSGASRGSLKWFTFCGGFVCTLEDEEWEHCEMLITSKTYENISGDSFDKYNWNAWRRPKECFAKVYLKYFHLKLQNKEFNFRDFCLLLWASKNS